MDEPICESDLVAMELHEEWTWEDGTRILRVPNGWIYYQYGTAVFVEE